MFAHSPISEGDLWHMVLTDGVQGRMLRCKSDRASMPTKRTAHKSIASRACIVYALAILIAAQMFRCIHSLVLQGKPVQGPGFPFWQPIVWRQFSTQLSCPEHNGSWPMRWPRAAFLRVIRPVCFADRSRTCDLNTLMNMTAIRKSAMRAQWMECQMLHLGL